MTLGFLSMVAVGGETGATTAGGCSGTLYADCSLGATNIKVSSVTNLTAGDFLKIGDAGETEIHEVATVGTVNGGTGVDLVTPLKLAHDAGDAYVEVDDAGPYSVIGTSIMDDTFTGFDYPNNATVVNLIGTGTSTYNAVLQQSALTARQAQLRCSVVDADMLLMRGWYDSREEVTFTDWYGTATTVRVLDFARSLKFRGVWDVSLTLLEAYPGA